MMKPVILSSFIIVVAAALVGVTKAEPCSFNPYPMQVAAGKVATFRVSPPELGNCTKVIFVVSPPTAGTIAAVGDQIVYSAPAEDTDDIAQLIIGCEGKAVASGCDLTVGFFVVTPVTTTTATPGPTMAPVPTTTTTPPTTLPSCGAGTSLDLSVEIGSVRTTTLNTEMKGCDLLTYRAAPTNAKGRLFVNLVGAVLATSGQFESVDHFGIVAYCDVAPFCTIPVNIISYAKVTPPPQPSTPAPLPACPSVYYYEANIGAVYTSSLKDMPGQLTCPYGRSFKLSNTVREGTLSLSLNGVFTYVPPARETWVSFEFTMMCQGVQACEGSANIMISGTVTVLPKTTLPENTPSTTPAPIFVSDGKITCSGTCNEDAWKAMPNYPMVWDDTPDEHDRSSHITPRKDRQPIGAIAVDWINSSLVITGYAKIGNVAARYFTFDDKAALSVVSGTRVANAQYMPALNSFNNSCLMQPNVGFAEEVWKWTSITNKTGHVGIRYNSGTSWYHKFGGKHINCDTYAKGPCKYAPLVNPGPYWTVDINDCDVTWRGSFNFSTLMNMTTAAGVPVFRFSGEKELVGSVLTQAIKPRSWLEPALGVLQETTSYTVSVSLEEMLRVRKSNHGSFPFTLDLRYFEYTDANGDASFGLNVLFFSVVTETSGPFSADRHVKGFKWLRQSWRTPTQGQCPQCNGKLTTCTVSPSASESSFTGAFPGGNCANGAGIVVLRKGPSMGPQDCSPNGMHVFNRSGFSAPEMCNTAFQNLTLRGTVVGSKGASSPILFDGVITLQLLLDNGNKPTIDIDLGLYVTRVSTNKMMDGTLSVCRSSLYYPVLDPLGTSLPNKPYRFWEGTSGSLCVDSRDNVFGPAGWAFFTLTMPGAVASEVVIDSIVMEAPNSAPIYLSYKDVVTGATVPPPSAGYYWKRTHPFLNFRDLTSAVVNNKTDIVPASVLPSGTVAAFALTPGAMNIDGELLITVVAHRRVTMSDGTTQLASATYRKYIYSDPLMTPLTRYGPPEVAPPTMLENGNGLVAMGILCGCTIGLLVVGLLFISGDDDRKLPKWMPRTTLVRRTVLSVVPKKLLNKKKKKAAPISDPYVAAMGPYNI